MVGTMSEAKPRPTPVAAKFNVDEIEKLVQMCRRNGVQELTLGSVSLKLGGNAFLVNPMIDNKTTPDAGAGASNKRAKSQAEQDEEDLFYSAR
jgi:hypothetical protein